MGKRFQNYIEARKCFSRALDADPWNIPAVTAWAKMEEELNNVMDARSIYERSLKRFSKCTSKESAEKEILWRAYELMESRLGNTVQAQSVYSRYIRECMSNNNNYYYNNFYGRFGEKNILLSSSSVKGISNENNINNDNNEIEVYRIT